MLEINEIAAEITKDATKKIVGIDLNLADAKNAVSELSKKTKAA